MLYQIFFLLFYIILRQKRKKWDRKKKTLKITKTYLFPLFGLPVSAVKPCLLIFCVYSHVFMLVIMSILNRCPCSIKFAIKVSPNQSIKGKQMGQANLKKVKNLSTHNTLSFYLNFNLLNSLLCIKMLLSKF